MVRQLKVLVLAFVTVCMLGSGVLAVVSAAAPMQLPGFTSPSAGVGTSLSGKLAVSGGAAITCTSDNDQLLFTGSSSNLGTYTIDFKGCSQGGATLECLSPGDASGVILLSGNWSLVLRQLPIHKWLSLILLPSAGLSVECPHSTDHQTLITGDVLGEMMPGEVTTATELWEILVHSTATSQEFTSYENTSGTAIATSLRVSQESGATKAGFEEGGEDTIKFAAASKIEQ